MTLDSMGTECFLNTFLIMPTRGVYESVSLHSIYQSPYNPPWDLGLSQMRHKVYTHTHTIIIILCPIYLHEVWHPIYICIRIRTQANSPWHYPQITNGEKTWFLPTFLEDSTTLCWGLPAQTQWTVETLLDSYGAGRSSGLGMLGMYCLERQKVSDDLGRRSQQEENPVFPQPTNHTWPSIRTCLDDWFPWLFRK